MWSFKNWKSDVSFYCRLPDWTFTDHLKALLPIRTIYLLILTYVAYRTEPCSDHKNVAYLIELSDYGKNVDNMPEQSADHENVAYLIGPSVDLNMLPTSLNHRLIIKMLPTWLNHLLIPKVLTSESLHIQDKQPWLDELSNLSPALLHSEKKISKDSITWWKTIVFFICNTCMHYILSKE